MKTNKKKLACFVLSAAFAFSAMGIGCNNPGGNMKSSEVTKISNLTSVTGTFTGQTKTLSKTTARDKILGAYIGSTIGIGSGYEFIEKGEIPVNSIKFDNSKSYMALPDMYWEPNGMICSGSIGCNIFGIGPISQPRVLKGVFYSDDDMHMDIGAQFMFRDYGPNLDGFDISKAWLKYGIMDAGGGWPVKDIAAKGYPSQFTGSGMYGNRFWHITEPWIENELDGLIFPYMANTCQIYNELFTSATGDGQSRYLGDLCSLMTALAWKYDGSTEQARKASVKSIIEEAFSMKNKNNPLYAVYQSVLSGYNKGTEWRTLVANECEKFMRKDQANRTGQDLASSSMECNAFMIFAGLLYGEGDFEKSVKITSLGALDGDCTASTVGGILGQLYGFNALPQKYRDFMNGNSLYVNHNGSANNDLGISWSAFSYMKEGFPTKLTFNQITDLTLSNLEAQVIARGGTVSDTNYNIKEQKVEACDSIFVGNSSFENGTEGWTVTKTDGATLESSETNINIGGIGTKCLKITAGENDSAKISQKVSLKRGSLYRLSIVMNIVSANREVRLFMGEYQRYFKPIDACARYARDSYRLELYAFGDGSSVDIGAEVVASTNSGVTTDVYLDDVEIEDVTNYIEYSGEMIMPEDMTLSDISAKQDDCVLLAKNDSLRFITEGTGTLRTMKIFYYTTSDDKMGEVDYTIDGIKKGTIPFVATGNETGEEIGVQTVFITVGSGTHTIRLTGKSGNVAITSVEMCG